MEEEEELLSVEVTLDRRLRFSFCVDTAAAIVFVVEYCRLESDLCVIFGRLNEEEDERYVSSFCSTLNKLCNLLWFPISVEDTDFRAEGHWIGI